MPTRKQIRMERKRDRHGYERPAGEAIARPADEKKQSAAGKSRRVGASVAARMDSDGIIQQGRRTFHPPSWKRSLKRVAVFPPFFFLLVHYVVHQKGTTVLAEIGMTALYSAAALPITFMMDRMVYNRAAKTFRARPRRRK